MSDADISGAMMVQRNPALGSTFSGGASVIDRSSPRSKDEEFTFADFLSAINPLHHLPVVGTLYRSMTGEEIKPAARMMGGALYGGPIGLLSAFANNVVEAESGKDIGGNVMALAGIDSGAKTPKSLAAGEPPDKLAAGEPPDKLATGEPPDKLAAGEPPDKLATGETAAEPNNPSATLASTPLPEQPDAFAGLRAADASSTPAAPIAVQRIALDGAPSAEAPARVASTHSTAVASAVPPADVLPSQADPFAFAYGKMTAQEATPVGETLASSAARPPSDPREAIASSQRDADAFAALRANDTPKPKPTQTARSDGNAASKNEDNWFNSAFTRGFDQYRKAAKSPQAAGPESHLNLTI